MLDVCRNRLVRPLFRGLLAPWFQRVRYRQLGPTDANLHAGHLLRLTPEGRRMRFLALASDATVLTYADRFDWDRAWVIGAFVHGVLRGVGELVWVRGSEPPQVEISLSVEGGFQHRGIGKRLMKIMVATAKEFRFAAVRLVISRENAPMHALLRKYGAKVTVSREVLEALVVLDPARPVQAMKQIVSLQP